MAQQLDQEFIINGNRKDLRRNALLFGFLATALIPINGYIWIMAFFSSTKDILASMFILVALVQLALGMTAMVYSYRYARYSFGIGMGMAVLFALVGLGGPISIFLTLVSLSPASSKSSGGL